MFETIITGAIVGVVSGGLTGWFASWLAIRRFRNEKWWERKAVAYSDLIHALHDAKQFTDAHLKAVEGGSEVPKDRDNELRERSRSAHLHIRRAMDVGKLLFSDATVARLDKFRKETAQSKNASDWYTRLENDLIAVDGCLKDLIVLARSDLGVD
jgi:hypothetical protein